MGKCFQDVRLYSGGGAVTRSSSYSIPLAFFLLLGTLLSYLWWDTVEHLMYLILSVDTFSHGQVIPFVSLWLIWTRKEHLRSDDVFVWLPATFLLDLACVHGRYRALVPGVRECDHVRR